MNERVLWGALACLVMAGLPLRAQTGGGSGAQDGRAVVVAADNLTGAHATPARKVALPGDTLVFAITFTNPAKTPARDVVFSDPLPKGVVLVGGSAQASAPAQLEYSTDGGRSWSAQPERQVVVNGQAVRQAAPPEAIDALRWTVPGPVAPGARVVAHFQARVAQRATP